MESKHSEQEFLDSGRDYVAELTKPHVDSFNYIIDEGLDAAVTNMDAITIDPVGDLPKVQLWFDKVEIGYPTRGSSGAFQNRKIYPNECRESNMSYSGPLQVHLLRQIGENPPERLMRKLGDVPIMVKSKRCHLHGLSAEELVKKREEATEFGGYFILNGIERLLRLLVMPRRNYVLGISRSSFLKRGPDYTSLATTIRCARNDQSTITINLHYLNDGTCNLRFVIRKQEYYVPVMIIAKALIDTTDREIYEKLVQKNTHNTFLMDRVELMLREARKLRLTRRTEFLSFLGRFFRVALNPPSDFSDQEVGEKLLEDYIFVHCENDQQKFELLLVMIQKVLAMASGDVLPDNPDALYTQEVLLPGHLYLMFLKEKLQDWLNGVRVQVLRDLRTDPSKVKYADENYWRRTMDKQPEVGTKVEYLLKTGNLLSMTGLDLMQVGGYTIVGDKLNYNRYMSHFRSIHRGQFFTTMKTTTVRKLLPESWGFLCPVHTPDGAPCGLLNHLSHTCEILTHPVPTDRATIISTLTALGMRPLESSPVLPHDYITVMLNGTVIGRVPPGQAKSFAEQVRVLKVIGEKNTMEGLPGLPSLMEVAVILDVDNVFPGIFLSTDPARFIRPVRHLGTNRIEYMGALEQVFLDIAVRGEDIRPGETTHQELKPINMLSINASFVPFSDHNQSPRNMYQCQMGKQTMGTPFHSIPHRSDNKYYRIQNPQRPLVQNCTYDQYKVDDYPLGANAVVAVISYTGYDMEDACILNKASYERGFGHASVYASYKVDLSEMAARGEPRHHYFANKVPGKDELVAPSLDLDGLPHVGQHVKTGDPLYCVVDEVTKKAKIAKHKSLEPAIVEQVRVYSSLKQDEPLQTMNLTLRYNRNPVIGDKFSSRHGQKGVLSVLWPQENMPFTESGLCPDVIINPHAFPSRMTIGMLIESMAAKSGALHGMYQDSTPFRFNEQHRAVDYFGEQLIKAGYSYYGSEPMYSGLTGTVFPADIYIGVVYYQRLRHMVSDKSQVRSTGPVNQIYRQPIKGRKKGGGIRFGEMERDSMIAHGASFMLHDRLMNCSDYHVAPVCGDCGSLLSPVTVRIQESEIGSGRSKSKLVCRNCPTGKNVSNIAVPYIFLYLTNELAAMNIRVTLDVK